MKIPHHKLLFTIVLFCAFFSGILTLQSGPTDSINKVDSLGLRQGYWKINNQMVHLEGYSDEQIVEEGSYVDNLKEGLWISYYPDGTKKSEITYKFDYPFGKVKYYYPNGNLQEEGTWLKTKWDGPYKYYYENGKLCYEWNYVKGQREGIQTYYEENGTIKHSGIWKNGVEEKEEKKF